MNSFGNKILTGISVIALLGVGYYGYAKVYPLYFAPCSKPLTYTVVGFDSRFGISRSDFEQALTQAEAVWETPSGHNLFQETANGQVSVNLIYDYRQQAMDKLKSLGITIDDSKKSYDQLNAQYQTKLAAYNALKSQVSAELATYDKEKAQYDKDVQAYNASRRHTQAQVDALQAEQDSLNKLADEINANEAALKTEVNDVNALVTLLNQLAGSLNLNVAEYNQVGQSTGSEFQEGVYSQNAGGRSIDIYEFTNHNELVRVLAHELGHALGLNHVDDPNAIMYKVNQATSLTATPADISELDHVCKF